MGITRFIDRSVPRLRSYQEMIRYIAKQTDIDLNDLEHYSEQALQSWETHTHKNAERVVFQSRNERKVAIAGLMKEYRKVLEPHITNKKLLKDSLTEIHTTLNQMFEMEPF